MEAAFADNDSVLNVFERSAYVAPAGRRPRRREHYTNATLIRGNTSEKQSAIMLINNKNLTNIKQAL